MRLFTAFWRQAKAPTLGKRVGENVEEVRKRSAYRARKRKRARAARRLNRGA